jgi:hypothetical protein
MGRIFKRGPIYWIAYCYHGTEHRESSHSENEAKALKLLKKRIGEVANGQLIGPSEERLSFDDLAKMLIIDTKSTASDRWILPACQSDICANSSECLAQSTSRRTGSAPMSGHGKKRELRMAASIGSWPH